MHCPVCGAQPDDAAPACPVCGADLATFAPGTVVADRYEVRALLGRGGMGAVYRAFDRVLDDAVALKVQLAAAAEDPEAEQRFRREVKLARQVSHPNVCRLHDGGQREALRWISMELVEGETLAARVGRGPLKEDEAWDLALQAAGGLAAVHRAGVVHRDLKPVNLMVDGSGRLRLMDFGIARPAAVGDPGTGGYAQGSPEYMSPEQARGRSADARSDVYSLGVVIFELFAGRVPFRADTPVATLLQHLETPPPLDRLPENLRPVLRQALAKDPGERFEDGTALADALRRAREGRDLQPSSRRGDPRRALAAAAVAVLAVVSAILLLRSPVEETSRPSVSPGPSSVPPGPAPTDAPVTPSPTPTPSPSHSAAQGPPPLESTPEPAATSPETAHPVPPVEAPSTAETKPPPSSPPPASEAEGPPVKAAESTLPRGQAEEEGTLLVLVRPWADVSVDGIPRGQTPLAGFPLPPGPHQVLLTHPDYRPYPRRVVIRPGETLRLAVDLRTDGVPRPR